MLTLEYYNPTNLQQKVFYGRKIIKFCFSKIEKSFKISILYSFKALILSKSVCFFVLRFFRTILNVGPGWQYAHTVQIWSAIGSFLVFWDHKTLRRKMYILYERPCTSWIQTYHAMGMSNT